MNDLIFRICGGRSVAFYRRRIAAIAIIVAILASACSSSAEDSSVALPADEASDGDSRPSLSNDESDGSTGASNSESESQSAPTSTITTTTSTTTLPETTTTTEPPLVEVVQLSAPGGAQEVEDAEALAAQVDQAIDRLLPGGTIEFGPGQYPPLLLRDVHGEPGQPVRFVGTPGAQFSGPGYSSDAGIKVENSSDLEIVGMTVRRALWGIYVSNTNGLTIRNNDVADIGQEAIRIKDGSSNIIIDANRVSDTGRRTDQSDVNGEGIYIGTGSPGGVDLVTNVVISNNVLSGIRDEAIDIKIPATNISVIDNDISNVVTGTSGAIVVHLNNTSEGDPNINIERNVIREVSRSSEFQDGNCIVAQTTVRIVNNVLHNCQHRGVYLRGPAGVATVVHNTFLNTGSIGTIVDEGLGIDMVSRNNLGAPGAENAEIAASDFVAADQADYRLNPDVASQYDSAQSSGVTDDLFGASRDQSGNATFGAVENQ